MANGMPKMGLDNSDKGDNVERFDREYSFRQRYVHVDNIN